LRFPACAQNPSNPSACASPLTAKAYVALGPANRVAVVDTATYQVTKYILVGQRVWQLAFTPDQKTVISTNGVSNDITFIDVATDEPVQSVTVGQLPWGVVVSPK
jgi:YVTN family beta-propeller protein